MFVWSPRVVGAAANQVLRHSGMVRRTRPGISRFRVRSFHSRPGMANTKNHFAGAASGVLAGVASTAGAAAAGAEVASSFLAEVTRAVSLCDFRTFS